MNFQHFGPVLSQVTFLFQFIYFKKKILIHDVITESIDAQLTLTSLLM